MRPRADKDISSLVSPDSARTRHPRNGLTSYLKMSFFPISGHLHLMFFPRCGMLVPQICARLSSSWPSAFKFCVISCEALSEMVPTSSTCTVHHIPACMSFMHIPIFVVKSLSGVWFLATAWTAARQASLSSTVSCSLLKFMSIEQMRLSNHLMLCRPLLLLPSYSKCFFFPFTNVFIYWMFVFPTGM